MPKNDVVECQYNNIGTLLHKGIKLMQKRLIAIGDIHGEIEKLNSLLDKLNLQT